MNDKKIENIRPDLFNKEQSPVERKKMDFLSFMRDLGSVANGVRKELMRRAIFFVPNKAEISQIGTCSMAIEFDNWVQRLIEKGRIQKVTSSNMEYLLQYYFYEHPNERQFLDSEDIWSKVFFYYRLSKMGYPTVLWGMEVC